MAQEMLINLVDKENYIRRVILKIKSINSLLWVVFASLFIAGCSTGGRFLAVEEQPPETPGDEGGGEEPGPGGAKFWTFSLSLTDADGNPISGTISGDSTFLLSIIETEANIAVKSAGLKVIEGLSDELPAGAVTFKCYDEVSLDVEVPLTSIKVGDGVYELTAKLTPPPAADCIIAVDATMIAAFLGESLGEEVVVGEFEAVPFATNCRTGYINNLRAATDCWKWNYAGTEVTFDVFGTNFGVFGWYPDGFKIGEAIEEVVYGTAFIYQSFSEGKNPCTESNVYHTTLTGKFGEGFDLIMFNNANPMFSTKSVWLEVYAGGFGSGSWAGYGLTGWEDYYVDVISSVEESTKELKLSFVDGEAEAELDGSQILWDGGVQKAAIDGFTLENSKSLAFSYFSGAAAQQQMEMGGTKLDVSVGKGGMMQLQEEASTAFTATLLNYRLGENCGGPAIDKNGEEIDP